MLSTIPFDGFYCSKHDQALDFELERMFADNDGAPRWDIISHAFDQINWQQVHTTYARHYTQDVAEACKIAMTFESMRSPKEYNFTTDRIFVTIEQDEVARLLRDVGHDAFSTVCKSQLTSRDGFASFYSPDYKTWGALKDWDHVQVGMVMLAYIGGIIGNKEQGQDSDDGMEGHSENGHIRSWIEEASTGLNRLYKINDYLNTRESR